MCHCLSSWPIISSCNELISVQHLPWQGRIQDFQWGGGGGGGGGKRWCASTHIMSAEPNSLSAGVQGSHKAPGSSRVILMLSRAIWALFLSILIKKLGEKTYYSWFNFRGGGAHACCAPPPPWICHCKVFCKLLTLPLKTNIHDGHVFSIETSSSKLSPNSIPILCFPECR